MAGALEAQSPNQEAVIDEIIVTGSHLRRADREGPAPVTVFDEVDLAHAGFNTLADFARHLTFNLGVPNDERMAASPAPGTSSFNLRGIGPQATLTLVNGRRIAGYGAPQSDGQTFVDLNSIPFAAIERIEVLKDGASAIYGAEAVAGVVNVILKRSLDGLALGGGYSSSTRGDASESTFELGWGRRAARTGLALSMSYLHRAPLRSVDRAYLAEPDLRRIGGFDQRSGFSSPMTVFRRDIRRLQAEPSCPPADSRHPLAYIRPVRQPHPVIDSFCSFNFKQFTHTIPATDRLGLTAVISHEIGPGLVLSFDVILNRNQTQTVLAPAPSDKTPLSAFTPLVRADHPDNPFARAVEINYRLLDVGAMSRRTEAESSRLVGGLEGDWGVWAWDLSLLFSDSAVDGQELNLVDSVAFQDALLGFGGATRDQYYNPFGFAPANSADVIEAFRIPLSFREERARERVIDLGFSRALTELAGGAARVAVGYQHREQWLSARGDSFQESGRALGSTHLRPLQASRSSDSVYVELGLPVKRRVEVQLAARHEVYSDFGTSTNPKLAVRWRATDTLALRSSFGSSFRAPSFPELFEAPRRVQGLIVDTHRCALTGAPFDCVPVPTDIERGGNSELNPERGESRYLGIVWSPRAVRGLDVDIDWWRFDHDARIVELPPAFVVEAFGLLPQFVVRGDGLPTDPPETPGRIEFVRATKVNFDALRTRGLDLDFRYERSLENGTDLGVVLRHTFIDKYEFTSTTDSERLNRDLAGGAELFPLPRRRSELALSLARANGLIVIAVRRVGSYRSPLNRVVDGLESDIPVTIEQHMTLDAQYQRTLPGLGDATVQVGCRNCIDAKPPVYNYTAMGEYLHDPRRAIVYVRWLQPL